MLEYLYLARWDDAFGFLASGSPPVYLRLAAVNAVFIALFGIRRGLGAPPMSGLMMVLAQLAVLGANLAILFQPQVESYLMTLRWRF